jgi:hypothetical protein
MKLSNLFKKNTETAKTSRIEPMSKDMLGKVIGGDGGTSVPLPVDAARVKSHSNQNNN